jgi:hypothetical protein
LLDAFSRAEHLRAGLCSVGVEDLESVEAEPPKVGEAEQLETEEAQHPKAGEAEDLEAGEAGRLKPSVDEPREGSCGEVDTLRLRSPLVRAALSRLRSVPKEVQDATWRRCVEDLSDYLQHPEGKTGMILRTFGLEGHSQVTEVEFLERVTQGCDDLEAGPSKRRRLASLGGSTLEVRTRRSEVVPASSGPSEPQTATAETSMGGSPSRKRKWFTPIAKFASPTDRTYPYEDLRGLGRRPPDVDPTRKEQYLSDVEFAAVFGMSKTEFGKLVLWKRLALKKQVGLW